MTGRCKRGRWRVTAVLSVAVLLWSCNFDDPVAPLDAGSGADTCEPGGVTTCRCEGGLQGSKRCNEEGEFGECRCSDAAAPADATRERDSDARRPDGESTGWPPREEPTFQTISTGARHTCALEEGGTPRCWGADGAGQVGAVDDVGPSLIDIAAGGSHTCAVRPSREIVCWGNNGVGQLGRNPSTRHEEPVAAEWERNELEPVTALQAGLQFSTGVSESGGALGWGENDSRQSRPGFGDLEEPTWRVAVLDLVEGTVVEVAAGTRHSCALREDGALRCWGDNRSGQLGFGPCSPGETPCSTEKKVAEVRGEFVSAAAGKRHTCALREEGTTVCWGSGEAGQLGDGGATDLSTALVEVDVGTELASLGRSLGDTQCGRTSDGRIFCWGTNGYGQATADPSDGSVVRPTRVDLPGSAIHVESGRHHTCALFRSGHVRCWGSDASGQLGPFAIDGG